MFVDNLHTHTLYRFHILVKLLFMICVLYYFRSAAPNAPDELQGETSDHETKNVNHNIQVPLVQFSSSNIQSRSQLCSERLDLLKLEAVGSQGIEVSDFEDILLNTPELQEINADNAKVQIFLNRHKPGTAILECEDVLKRHL